ncbi:uncharacterized protein LOC123869474 [Maniola jurtina]|uniref:uncharacterized protein LOC123869474 n=1 Tax=Maniola jurtina TaxID=191418 RepID=UPI001E68F3FE|nr:uncharacterized protein LOC123869474 [Maniola jurtina]
MISYQLGCYAEGRGPASHSPPQRERRCTHVAQLVEAVPAPHGAVRPHTARCTLHAAHCSLRGAARSVRARRCLISNDNARDITRALRSSLHLHAARRTAPQRAEVCACRMTRHVGRARSLEAVSRGPDFRIVLV